MKVIDVKERSYGMVDIKKILEEYDILREKTRTDKVMQAEEIIINLLTECLHIVVTKVENRDFNVVNGFVQVETDDDFAYRIIKNVDDYMSTYNIDIEDLRLKDGYIVAQVKDLDEFKEYNLVGADRVTILSVRFKEPHIIGNVSSIYINSIKNSTSVILVD